MRKLYQTLGLEAGGVVSIVGAGGKTSLMFRLAHEISASGATVLTTTTTKIILPTRQQSRHVVLTTSARSLLADAGRLFKETRHISAAWGRHPQHPGKVVGFPAAFIDGLRQSGMFRWIIVEADGAARKPLKAPAAHEPVVPESSGWVVGVVSLAAIGRPLGPEWVFRHDRYASLTGLAVGMPLTPTSVVKVLTHPAGIFKKCPAPARKILFLNTAGKADRRQAAEGIIQELAESRASHDLHRVVVGSPLEKGLTAACFDL